MKKVYTLKDLGYMMHRLIDLPDMLAGSHKSKWKHGEKAWENILKPALIEIVKQSSNNDYHGKTDLWLLDDVDSGYENIYNDYSSSNINNYIYCMGNRKYADAKKIAFSFYKDLRKYNKEKRDFYGSRKNNFLFINKLFTKAALLSQWIQRLLRRALLM